MWPALENSPRTPLSVRSARARDAAAVLLLALATLATAAPPAPPAPLAPAPTPAHTTQPPAEHAPTAPTPPPDAAPAKTDPAAPATPAKKPAPAAKPAATTPAKIDTTTVDANVVQIVVKTDLGNGMMQTSTGTGVYLGSGRVLTASHVVSRYTVIEVIFGGRSGQPRTVATFDPTVGNLVSFPSRDVSVLTKITAPSWATGVSIAKTSPKTGEQAVSFGLKDPATPRIRQGEVLPSGQMRNGIEIDAISTKGDSGGPTFDSSLHVIGVHSGNVSRTRMLPGGRQEEKVTSVSFNVVGLDVSTVK